MRKFGSRRVARIAFVLAALAAMALAGTAQASTASPVRSSYTSFFTSVSAYALSYSGSLQVRGYASYRNYSCSPSYRCDQNVMVQFTLHRGYSIYSPIVGRTYGQTGQYGSSVSATFTVPSCRWIPRYQSVTYTVEMRAFATDGQQKTAQTYAYLRSCA
jgi:hypothetical protein